MTKIPFNIKYRPQIESGEYRVVTRENRPVEIRIWDLKGDFPVVGVYFDEKNNRETAVQVTAEGRCSIKPSDDYCDDFFIITSKSDLTEFESAVQEIFYKGREDNIDLLKITSNTLLMVARRQMMKVITLCGSTRFKDQFLEQQKRLTLEGNVVISVGLFGHSGDEEVWKPGMKEMLDKMHLQKIDMADEIFVINVGGYIGESTRREIAHAEKTGKKIVYLEK